MRALVLLLAVVAAGCASVPAEPASPTPTPVTPSATPTPPSVTVVIEEACVPLTLSAEPAAFVPGEYVDLRLTLRNCTAEPLRATLPYCAKPGELELRILVDGVTLYLGNGAAVERLSRDPCETFPREIPPNGTFEPQFSWSGTRSAGDCDGCPYGGAWMPAGDYAIEAMLRSAEGDEWRAGADVTFLPPRLPPYALDGAITLLLDESYARGATATVQLRNDGNASYRYRTFYAACDMKYYDAEGYPFLIPPGTHCDIANDDVIRPGQTVKLFTWKLERCVKDHWGCAEAQPLPPGTYHIAAQFHEDVERWWEHPENVTRTGATFRIT